MSINVTEFGTSTNVADLFINLNIASNGWFTGLLLLFMWLMFVGISQTAGFSFSQSFFSASFVTFALASLLFAIDALSVGFLIFSIVLVIGSTLYALFS